MFQEVVNCPKESSAQLREEDILGIPDEDEEIIVIDDDDDDDAETETDSFILVNYLSTSIYASDLRSLRKGEYLNDTIISFYLSHLHENMMSKECRDKIYIFSPLFFTCLTRNHVENGSLEKKKRHANVKDWTKNTNIFDYKCLIFPICKSSHWFLIIIIQ